MIFIGYNLNISCAKYYNHHPKWHCKDGRVLPKFVKIWWNNLKKKNPQWQILEWMISYSKPYCQECMRMWIKDDRTFLTKNEKQKEVIRLNSRFNK